MARDGLRSAGAWQTPKVPARTARFEDHPRRRLGGALLPVAAMAAALLGCDASPVTTPPITPGTAAGPRVVVILAKDYSYSPAIVDLVPGERVLLQVINGGLAPHEVVIGDQRVQDAWEAAEAPTASAPPGAAPAVSIDPALGGLRVVVRSGERFDVTWTVPADAGGAGDPWLVGCHIPGHWAEGMAVPVRFVGAGGVPVATRVGEGSQGASPKGSVIP
jgi:hypothetical protein